MHWDVSKAVEKGILKPISEVRSLEEKESDDYKEGLIFGNDIPDVMCNTVKSSRVDFIHQRAEFSKYLVLPTKFGFKKVVRIMALVLTFISKCRRKATTKLKLDMAAMQDGFKFTLFFVQMTDKEISGNDDGAAGHPNDMFGDGDKQLIEVPEEQSSPPHPFRPCSFVLQKLARRPAGRGQWAGKGGGKECRRAPQTRIISSYRQVHPPGPNVLLQEGDPRGAAVQQLGQGGEDSYHEGRDLVLKE